MHDKRLEKKVNDFILHSHEIATRKETGSGTCVREEKRKAAFLSPIPAKYPIS
jgi:hypothetical protein